MSTILIRARFETPHNEFEAYGKDVAEALETLKDGWAIHCKQTGAETDYIEKYKEDIEILPFELGQCFRDRHYLVIDVRLPSCMDCGERQNLTMYVCTVSDEWFGCPKHYDEHREVCRVCPPRR